ncbi:MAG: flagellin [Halanaerobium sp.]
MRINTNLAALNSYNNLNQNHKLLLRSFARLSSGRRINSSADDAAGLAISEKMKAQIKGLSQAQRNAQDAVSLVQTAEGGLKESHSILQRLRELAVQAANDTLSSSDRENIQLEIDQLAEELTSIGDRTQFNTKNLLDGSFDGVFQIGANQGQTVSLKIADMRAEPLGVMDSSGETVKVSDHESAAAAVTLFDDAIAGVSSERSKLGAVQNRLGHTINNLETTELNLTAAKSRIADVDMAREMMGLMRQQILVQAGIAVLAQSNQLPQGILQLLG